MTHPFLSFRTGLAALACLLLPFVGRAQVGVGTTTPDAKAALEVRATDKGLLIPRLTAGQRTGITAPPQGLLVYQTDGTPSGGPQTGFWYFAGQPAAWVFLSPTGAADNLGNHTATQALNLQGQALIGTGASIGTAVGVGVRADGGLNLGQNTPGNNIFLGYQSGQATTTGFYNHFSGLQSGYRNTTGSNNQFNGLQSGYSNTTGSNNQFDGNQSGYFNTTGSSNLFIGYDSGLFNTSGSNNQFEGYLSGSANSTGSENHFSGNRSGNFNTTGRRNQFSGYQSGYFNTTGNNNYFSGYQSGYSNTTSSDNFFGGYQSGYSNTTGSDNFFGGFGSGYSNTTGDYNVFSGEFAGEYNTTGNYNAGFGYAAGPSTGTLNNATAIGALARVSQSNSLVLGSTGFYAVNVGIGTGTPADRLHVYGAGTTVVRIQSSDGFGAAGLDFWSNPQGTTNEWRPAAIRSTDEGNFTGGLIFYTNGTGFANRASGFEQMRVLNGGLTIGAIATAGYRLYVNGTVRCATLIQTSDQRLKQDIRPLSGALTAVLALRGVRYRWNELGVQHGGQAGAEQVGLLAQEVEKIYPELVSTGTDGFKAVNYAQLAPVLIEALKELKTENDALAGRVAALQAPAAQATADHAALLALQAQVARLQAAGAQAAK